MKFPSKNLVEAYVFLRQEWSQGALKIDIFEILYVLESAKNTDYIIKCWNKKWTFTQPLELKIDFVDTKEFSSELCKIYIISFMVFEENSCQTTKIVCRSQGETNATSQFRVCTYIYKIVKIQSWIFR